MNFPLKDVLSLGFLFLVVSESIFSPIHLIREAFHSRLWYRISGVVIWLFMIGVCGGLIWLGRPK